jgi:hypothetical protein
MDYKSYAFLSYSAWRPEVKMDRTELPGLRITAPIGGSRLGVVELRTKVPSLIPESAFRLLGKLCCASLDGPFALARIEGRENSTAEDHESEEYEDYAEHGDSCSYMEWLKQNKKQREFISKQILIMLDRVRREQDPEALAFLLGKIACFESELDILEERSWKLRDEYSDHHIPWYLSENIWEKELCDVHSRGAGFKKGGHRVSPYMFYTEALHEIQARMKSPDAGSDPAPEKKRPTVSMPASIKKRYVRSTPTLTKKGPAKSPHKHGSISIVVRY